jgi:hypothetical protein
VQPVRGPAQASESSGNASKAQPRQELEASSSLKPEIGMEVPLRDFHLKASCEGQGLPVGELCLGGALEGLLHDAWASGAMRALTAGGLARARAPGVAEQPL